MVNLVIDIGNTRTKVAIFNNRELISLDRLDYLDEEKLERYLTEHLIQQSIISSVKDEISSIEQILASKTTYIRFSADTKNGIDNQYKTPGTLGLDRLAGVIAARSLYPGQNCLVIDAGTCITYDAVDTKGTYKGGAISPGLNMRLKAMNSFTGRLPLVRLVEFEQLEGYDTVTSMLSGVLNGTIAELKGIIESYSTQYVKLQVLLCGGDANFFDSRLKSSIFAHTLKTEPNLVLIGLNEVIHQQ